VGELTSISTAPVIRPGTERVFVLVTVVAAPVVFVVFAIPVVVFSSVFDGGDVVLDVLWELWLEDDEDEEEELEEEEEEEVDDEEELVNEDTV